MNRASGTVAPMASIAEPTAKGSGLPDSGVGADLDALLPRVNPAARAVALAGLYWKLPFLKRRIRRPVVEAIDGVPLLVLPEVLNPVVFRSGAWLARTLATSPFAAPPRPGARALDMGTGSGASALFAACSSNNSAMLVSLGYFSSVAFHSSTTCRFSCV